MTRTFTITEDGRKALRDLIEHTVRELNVAIEAHGAHSIEAARQHLILGLMHYQTEDFEGAEPHIWSYVTFSQQKCGPNSAELFTGLILLSINCIGWKRSVEETFLVFDRLKLVSGRCHERRDPVLEGLYDAATRYQDAGDPVSQQQGFILFLMALSWCVRYPSGHNYSQFDPEVKVVGYHEIYARYIRLLKPVFETYGFVEERWDWLIRHCNHNLHDLVGLISLLHEKHILPSDTERPPTAETRETSIRSLVQEFPVCKGGTLRDQILATGGHPMKLEFMCTLCCSRDLRTMFMEPYYPISTLDGIAVDPGNVDLCDLIERVPSEYEGQGHTEGWQFWCDKCGLEPKLDQNHEEEESHEEALARWLLENCPQDEGLPAPDNSRSEG